MPIHNDPTRRYGPELPPGGVTPPTGMDALIKRIEAAIHKTEAAPQPANAQGGVPPFSPNAFASLFSGDEPEDAHSTTTQGNVPTENARGKELDARKILQHIKELAQEIRAEEGPIDPMQIGPFNLNLKAICCCLHDVAKEFTAEDLCNILRAQKKAGSESDFENAVGFVNTVLNIAQNENLVFELAPFMDEHFPQEFTFAQTDDLIGFILRKECVAGQTPFRKIDASSLGNKPIPTWKENRRFINILGFINTNFRKFQSETKRTKAQDILKATKLFVEMIVTDGNTEKIAKSRMLPLEVLFFIMILCDVVDFSKAAPSFQRILAPQTSRQEKQQLIEQFVAQIHSTIEDDPTKSIGEQSPISITPEGISQKLEMSKSDAREFVRKRTEVNQFMRLALMPFNLTLDENTAYKREALRLVYEKLAFAE